MISRVQPEELIRIYTITVPYNVKHLEHSLRIKVNLKDTFVDEIETLTYVSIIIFSPVLLAYNYFAKY